MEQIYVEIRDSEGGQDAKLLVQDMANIYLKAAQQENFNASTSVWRDGFVCLWISGKHVKRFFQHESGGHRWQRISPTEKRGRTHTSTVSVVILDPIEINNIEIDFNVVKRTYTRGTGPGGQHRNKVETCVVLKHIPTDIVVKVDNGRSRHHNEQTAWKELKTRLYKLQQSKLDKQRSLERNKQIVSGGRGDKRRTYRVSDNQVTDHITGKKTTLKNVLKGRIKLLH